MSPQINLIAAALGLAVHIGAAAQTITLYGVLDSGIERVNHVGPDNRSLTRVPTITGTIPSRWGIRGGEELGGGLKALFALESGIAMDSGMSNQGGRLFGLQSWVGVSGRWGQITVGRQLTMLLLAFYDTDIMGPNIYGIGSFDNYLPNARADNSLAYRGKYGAVTVGGMISTGRDTVNAGPSPSGTNCAGETTFSRKSCREWSAMVGYDRPGWGANVAIDTLHGGSGAFGGLTSAAHKDQRTAVGAYLRQEKAKIAASWIRRNNDGSATPRSDLISAGVSYDMARALNLAGQVSWIRYRGTDNRAALVALRATYALSKRTAAYANLGLVDNRGQLAFSASAGAPGANPVAGGNQMGTMLGLRHTF